MQAIFDLFELEMELFFGEIGLQCGALVEVEATRVVANGWCENGFVEDNIVELQDKETTRKTEIVLRIDVRAKHELEGVRLALHGCKFKEKILNA